MLKVTTDLAREFKVTAQTIRTWSTRFSAFLSPSAAVAGRTRRFDPGDVEVLTLVAELRRLQFSYTDIAARLQFGERPIAQEEPEPDEAEVEKEPDAIVSLAQVELVMSSLMAVADEWRALAEDRRQETKALREENRRLRIELAQQPRRSPWRRRVFGR